MSNFMAAIEPLINSNETDVTIKEHTQKDKSMDFIIRKKQTHQELVPYLHASCASPSITTFVKAIKNDKFAT